MTMYNTVEIVNFEEMCRMCLNKSETFIPISSSEVITMIMASASVQVFENDELPQQICESCYSQLENAFRLRQITEHSDVMLRQALAYRANNFNHNQILSVDLQIGAKDEKPAENDLKQASNISNIEHSIHFPDEDVLLRLQPPINVEIKDEDVKIDSDSLIRDSESNDSIPLMDEETLLRLQQITGVEHKYAMEESQSSDNLLEINKIVLENLNLIEPSTKDEGFKEIIACLKCSKTFKKASILGMHMKRVHKADPIKCDQCSVLCYHELHLKAHKKIHMRRTFACDVCKKKFVNSNKLDRHKVSHTSERPFPCLQCNSTFKDKWVLFKHIKIVHMNMEKHAECPVCHKSFVAYRLKDHLVIHEKDRKTFTCDVCSKVLYSKVSLDKHVKLYHSNMTRELKHLCNICGRVATSAALLKAHLRTHTGEKPFECDLCENRYRTKFALKKHVSRVHLKERNHVCAICSDAFADKKTLMNHVRHHTGMDRPFKCDYCEKAYGYKMGLKQHMKTVHSK